MVSFGAPNKITLWFYFVIFREELENEIDCLKAEVAEINDMWQQSKKITTGFVRQLKDVEAKIKMKSDELNRAKSLHRACKQILEDLIKSKVPDMASQVCKLCR